MTQISGSLVCVTEKPASISEVWVRAPELRATAGAVVTTDPDRYSVVDGAVAFLCAPGPAVLVLIAGGMPVATVPIVVADAESMTLQDAVVAAELADTSTVSQLEQLAAEATLAVTDARAEADRAASLLSTKANVVHTHSIEQVDGLQSALDGKASLVGGLVPTAQLPAVALTKPQVVADKAGMLALTAQEGDVAVITAGVDKGTYMLGTGSPSVFESWVPLAAPTDAVTSVNGQTGVVNLSASDVGAVTKQYADGLVDWSTSLQDKLWGHVPFSEADGSISAEKFWIKSQVGYAVTSGYVDTSIINAPKLHTWNGSGSWVAPANAGPNDLVLNTATKEIFSVQVV